jgi:hypothetical protein
VANGLIFSINRASVALSDVTRIFLGAEGFIERVYSANVMRTASLTMSDIERLHAGSFSRSAR